MTFWTSLYLEHIEGTALVALTDHDLADQVGILSHQHVLETVDLKQRQESAPVNAHVRCLLVTRGSVRALTSSRV